MKTKSRQKIENHSVLIPPPQMQHKYASKMNKILVEISRTNHPLKVKLSERIMSALQNLLSTLCTPRKIYKKKTFLLGLLSYTIIQSCLLFLMSTMTLTKDTGHTTKDTGHSPSKMITQYVATCVKCYFFASHEFQLGHVSLVPPSSSRIFGL